MLWNYFIRAALELMLSVTIVSLVNIVGKMAFSDSTEVINSLLAVVLLIMCLKILVGIRVFIIINHSLIVKERQNWFHKYDSLFDDLRTDHDFALIYNFFFVLR